MSESKKKRPYSSKDRVTFYRNSNARPYDSAPRVEKMQMEQKISIDTFSDDFSKVNQTIQDAYGDWHNQEYMGTTINTIYDMKKRLTDVKKYKEKYAKDWEFDVDNALDYYNQVIEGWEEQSSIYNEYKNADAFGKAKRKAEFDYKYSKWDEEGNRIGGLTYDEVQEEKKKYEVGSEEYEYLNNYTGYSNLSDFDKALAMSKGQYVNERGQLVNSEDKFKVHAPIEDIEKATTSKGSLIDGLNALPSLTKGQITIPDEANPEVAKAKRENAILDFAKDLGMESNNAPASNVNTNEKFIAELERARNLHALDNQYDYYRHYEDEEGYEETSKYDESIDNQTYKYINDAKFREDLILNNSNFATGDIDVEEHGKGYELMYDNERNTFNHLFKTYGEEEALSYLEGISSSLLRRKNLDHSEFVKSEVDKGTPLAWFMNITNPVRKMMGAPASMVGTISDAVSGNGYNPYASYNDILNSTSYVQQHTSDKIAESTNFEIGGVNVASFLYNTTMSIGDTLVGGATLGSLYSVVAGYNSFQQKARELTEAGENQDVVLANALASGTAEMLFEKISIDNWLKIKNVDGLKKGVVNVLKQMGIEGSEEAFTEIANIVAEAVFRGDNSELAQYKQDLIDKGYTEEEAGKMTHDKAVAQVHEALAGGFLSGFALGGGSSIANGVDNRRTGKTISANGQADAMWDVAAMTPQESETYKLYTEYAEKGVNSGNIKYGQLGNLYNTADSESIDTLKDKKSSSGAISHALVTQDKLSEIDKPSLEKRIEKDKNDAKAKASEYNIGEVSEITDSGDSFTLTGRKIVDGEVVLETSEGDIALSEVTLDEKNAMLVAYSENMSEDKGNLFVKNYDSSVDVDQYFEDFTNVYEMSAKGYSENNVIKQSGSLTMSQVGAIHNNAIMIAEKEFKQVVEAINEKSGGNFFGEGKFDDSVITSGKVKWSSLGERQRQAITFMRGVSKALGVNIKLEYEGKKKGYNGWYDPSDNTIHIDVHAGIDKAGDVDTIIPTLSHEMTHWMKAKEIGLYNKMKDVVLDTFDAHTKGQIERVVQEEMNRLEKTHPKEDGSKYTEEEAMDEILARACEDMLTNSETLKEYMSKLTESEQKTFMDKVKQMFKDILNWVNELLGQYEGASRSAEARVLRKYKERFEELQSLFDEALKSAIETNQAAMEQGTTVEKVIKAQMESLQFNRRYVNEHMEKLEELYSEEASVDLGTLMDRYNTIIDIWDEIGIELNSKFLKEWNDNFGKDREFTIFKAQTGYKYNVELSTMCKKGVPLFEAIDTIVKKEVMKQLNTDKIGKAEKEILYDILKESHFEIPCAICYVEQARQREGVIIDAFLNGSKEQNSKGKYTKYKLGWNEVLDQIQNEMKANGVDFAFPSVDRNISTENYTPQALQMDEKTQKAFYNALKKVTNDEITRYNKENKKSRKLVKDGKPQDIKTVLGGTLPTNLRIFKALYNEPNSRFRIEDDLLYSSATTRNLAMAHQGLYSLFNSQGGVSGYKTKQGAVVYWGDILKKNYDPSKVRKEGGIRNQSNSDSQMYTLLDQVQMYIDFSAKGYYLQAYTKVVSELKLLGLSNAKINASTIPRVIEYKNADGTVDVEKTRANAGLDENGNPIFDDIEGINHKEAFMLAEDENYSKSICCVCIGYSDNHILKLLDDNRIQQIIGFHDKTDNPDKRYRGARYSKNYNGINEAKKISNGETVHVGFNQFIKKAENKFKKNGEDFEGTIKYNGKTYTANDIPRLATDLYLEHCEKKGLYPAYSQGETDFSKHPNYYKLLADFGLYDSKGNYAPHRKVTYDMPEQVPYLDKNGNKAYMKTKDYIKQELELELKVRDDLAVKLADTSSEGIIPKFVKRVNELHDGTSKESVANDESQFSDRSYAPTFYSHMGKVVDGIKQDKIGANSVVNYLKGKGVKDEEIKWSGIETFLDGKKSVTKAELQEFVSGSMLQIEEHTNAVSNSDALTDALEEHTNISIFDYIDEFRNGVDYDELRVAIAGYRNDGDIDEETYRKLIDLTKEDEQHNVKWYEYITPFGENYRELLFKMPNSTYSNASMKAHWGKEGILAHARIQDMKTDNGKMLFIEEIQSDWHNEGQKIGYKNPNKIVKDKAYYSNEYQRISEEYFEHGKTKGLIDKLTAIGYEGAGIDSMLNLMVDDERSDYARDVFSRKGGTLSSEEIAHLDKYKDMLKEIYELGNEAPAYKPSVPEAPFKNNYHEYVLKRLIRMASEEGYDSIGWTTGQMQEERWSSEYAEGYRIEYDQDIPKFLRKYGKKWGATVGKTTLRFGDEVWSMDITDAMKQSVLYEGQVMYSDRNYGYHAGDLGKAESYAEQGYGRDTGHFGTGTYFVGDEEKINIGGYKERPHEKVDFSKYKLYKVYDSDTGYRLHDFLRGVDGFFNLDEDEIRTEREWERRKDDLDYAIFDENISEEDAIKEAKILFGNYSLGNKIQKMANAPEGKWIGLDTEGGLWLTDQETNHDEEIPLGDLNKYVDVYDVISNLIYENRYAPRIISRIESWDDSLDFNSTVLFGKTKQEVLSIINEVKEDIASANYSYEDTKTADSASTRFMKKLGYEGIDVRGTSLDNTMYGSVIYDLKGEDLARKQEIGTAKYSDRDTEGTQLTKEQADFFKDSKVRDKDGNLKVMYHGSPSKFTIFEDKPSINGRVYGDGFYFTENSKDAKAWGKGGKLYKSYLNIKNPFVVSSTESVPTEVERVLKERKGEVYDRLSADTKWWGNKYTRDEYVEEEYNRLIKNTSDAITWLDDKTTVLKSLGYDGIVIMNESKSPYYKGMDYREVVVFDSNQIKLTTNTNPTDNDDIRYADRDARPYGILEEEYRLAEENKRLKEDIRSLRYILQIEREKKFISTLDESRLKSAAKHLLEKVDSKYNRTDFEDGMREIFLYIGESENVDGNAVINKCVDLARRVMDKSGGFENKNKYFDRLIKDIQNASGNIDGDIESAWNSLAKKYPKVFSKDVNPSDMATELLGIMNATKETAEMYQGFNKDQARMSLATEIYNQYWHVSNMDTKNQEIQKLRLKHRDTMQVLRDKNKEIQDQRLADTMYYGKIINKVKKEKDAKYKHMREVGDRNERMRKLKIDITKKAMTLNRWLKVNSKKEHINEDLKPLVRGFLYTLDFSSKTNIDTGGQVQTKADMDFAKALRQVHEMMAESTKAITGEGKYYGIQFDEGFITNVGMLVKIVDDKLAKGQRYVLNQLNLEELQVLHEMVSKLKKGVEMANEFHSIENKQGISNHAQSMMQDAEKLGQIEIHKGIRGWFDSMLNFKNKVPHYFFKMLGENGMKVFKAFQDGWDKFAKNTHQVIKFTRDLYKAKEVKEWRKEIHTIEHRGNKIQMITPQLMALYCLSKREQALKHITQGGIHISDIDNGKSVIAQNFTVHFTEAELKNLFQNELSERQIHVAEALQKFMNTECTKWGNEVTLKLYGIEQFGLEEFYFPIKSDQENINKDEQQTANENPLFRLLNMSFSKPLNEDASNRIMVLDIFEVFATHTSDMAKYNALALPVIDTYKLLNYRERVELKNGEHDDISFKRSMNKAYGKEAMAYIYEFLKDLNGTENTSRDSTGGKFFSYAKISSVGANIRVALLQPTAYVKARLVMKDKYLWRALIHKPSTIKKNYERAKEYCGMVLWKSMGFYDTNISRGVLSQITHDETFRDKLVESTMKGAEIGDQITIAYLWTACEHEIRETRTDLEERSEEFYQAIGLRLREIIYSTQVVDSTLTRSSLMRSGNLYDKMLTAFGSEPTLSLNMLQDAFLQYKLTERAEGKAIAKKKHGKNVARAISTYTLTGIVVSIIATAMDMYRDNDDEEEEDEGKLMKAYIGNLTSELGVLGKIPYIKELISCLNGFSSTRTDTQWMEQFANTVNGFAKVLNGNGNPYTVAKNILRTLSSLRGLPIYTAYRDIMAGLDKLGWLEEEDLEEMLKDLQ